MANITRKSPIGLFLKQSASVRQELVSFSISGIFPNNLRDIPLEEEYAGICGMTQTEFEANFQPEIQILAQK